MWSSPSQATTGALFDMQLNGIVTNQTSQLAIDFVAYNGHVDPWIELQGILSNHILRSW